MQFQIRYVVIVILVNMVVTLIAAELLSFFYFSRKLEKNRVFR
jgi:flagellar basal body-associated protein FliL